MTNRIAHFFPDDSHPLDSPELQAKQKALRFVCLALILGTVFVTIGVTATVKFALGGNSLPKLGASPGGIPILTIVGAVLTLSAVSVASLVVPFLTNAGLKKIAAEPTSNEPEAERIWTVYAKGKFVEFALAEGAAVVTAILYHLSADWLMLAFVAGMVGFLIVRFPTWARNRRWYDEAAGKLDLMKR